MARRRHIQRSTERDGGEGVAFFVGGILFAFAGVMIGVDQYSKRQQEEELFRRKLEALSIDLNQKEHELATLQALLGPKNEQVRRLSEEVLRLRAFISTQSARQLSA